MASEHVIARAAQLLKGNAVQIVGSSRVYEVGIADRAHRVYVTQNKSGLQSFQCDCEHGRNNGVIVDPDLACSHIVAAIEFDARLMQRYRERHPGLYA